MGFCARNHYAYGSIAEWLFRDVAGIAPAAPGFRKAKLAPHLNVSLGKAEAEYRSASGTWKAAWSVLPDGDVSYRCTVPFGCTAELKMPHGGGTYSLEAGIFETVYTPDKPLRKIYSTQMPIGELLEVPKVKAALCRVMPQITQLPPSMAGLPMRVLAAKMGAPAAMLDKLDAMLANI